MLYVKLEGQPTVSFHVEETDVIFDFKRQVESIVLVQADGDELDYIIGNFSVSVRNDAKLLIWFGDDAKFIVANW